MVHTAVAIKNKEVIKESVASTEVMFSDLTDEAIRIRCYRGIFW